MTNNNRLTNEELAQIRERAEEATEGPWRVGKQSPNGLNNVGTMGGLMTAQTFSEDDAAFIAHSREDIPKLLAEIDRLEDTLHDAYQEVMRGKNGRAIDIIEKWGDNE